jgi:ABC-type nitrate/sulfonate/bicarbonate transport system substrate-binding protein
VVTEPYVEWGIKERCFEKYGIRIESVSGTSQSARIAGLVGGSLDVVSQTPQVVLQAIANGDFDPLFVSAHYGYSAEAIEAARQATAFEGKLLIENVLIGAPGSSVKSWGDLNGAKIGVLNTNGSQVFGLYELSKMGLFNIATVEFIQLDPREILNGLLRGELDAGGLTGALALEALSAGGTVVGYPVAYFAEPGPFIVWVAGQDISEEKKELLKRFRSALWEIYELLKSPDYREDLLDLMQLKFELEPETRQATVLPDLLSQPVTIENLEAIIPKMLEFGQLDKDITLSPSMFLDAQQ